MGGRPTDSVVSLRTSSVYQMDCTGVSAQTAVITLSGWSGAWR
ncbi:hypothetical protein ACFQHW_00880 [Lapidilactobacillus achengensis]|uniref:Uncharacterized protein n=1 Tax=Lapidilactobacillus achengensis TaxID=2486000 RepID=A0ABW1UJM6_9LACO|nr:hypothetical protein [Lapidilactobacillus achengensis]